MYQHLIFCFTIDSGSVNITGIYYFSEALLYNCVMIATSIITIAFNSTDNWVYHTFSLLAIGCFNLGDSYVSFIRDLSSIKNLILIEKKSLLLSQFVDRLLPKHVSPINL